jgi:hypothetical protein
VNLTGVDSRFDDWSIGGCSSTALVTSGASLKMGRIKVWYSGRVAHFTGGPKCNAYIGGYALTVDITSEESSDTNVYLTCAKSTLNLHIYDTSDQYWNNAYGPVPTNMYNLVIDGTNAGSGQDNTISAKITDQVHLGKNFSRYGLVMTGAHCLKNDGAVISTSTYLAGTNSTGGANATGYGTAPYLTQNGAAGNTITMDGVVAAP